MVGRPFPGVHDTGNEFQTRNSPAGFKAESGTRCSELVAGTWNRCRVPIVVHSWCILARLREETRWTGESVSVGVTPPLLTLAIALSCRPCSTPWTSTFHRQECFVAPGLHDLSPKTRPCPVDLPFFLLSSHRNGRPQRKRGAHTA